MQSFFRFKTTCAVPEVNTSLGCMCHTLQEIAPNDCIVWLNQKEVNEKAAFQNVHASMSTAPIINAAVTIESLEGKERIGHVK